jgi:hypothetical protein
MNLVERLLHIAPDGGSGMLEATFMLIAVLVPIGMAIMRHLKGVQTTKDLQGKF